MRRLVTAVREISYCQHVLMYPARAFQFIHEGTSRSSWKMTLKDKFIFMQNVFKIHASKCSSKKCMENVYYEITMHEFQNFMHRNKLIF